MARVENVARAKEVFELYRQYPEFNPVQLHTGIKSVRQRELIRQKIVSKEARIIVCVDMLGEGFDLPELKIAAFHDIRKTLAVTLQLAGRFTRARPDLEGEKVLKLLDIPPDDTDHSALSAELKEMAVEYILGILVFGGIPNVYCRTHLRLLALHPKTSQQEGSRKDVLLLEHLVRCFLVWSLLKYGTKGPMTRTPQEWCDHVKEWWDTFARQIQNDDLESIIHVEYRRMLTERLSDKIQSTPILSYFVRIVRAVDMFLGQNSEECKDKPRVKALRREWFKALGSTNKKVDKQIAGFLESKWTFARPADVDFGITGLCEKQLHSRRLESLIGYLALTRSLCSVLDRWIEKEKEAKVFLSRENISSEPDFSNYQYGPFLLDPATGVPFSIGCDVSIKYMNIRLAFLKSMWHLSEVSKETEIVSILRMAKRKSDFLFPNLDAE